ncbi:hypothetical protein Tco_0946922 [Tanacetum coccineum]
MLDIFALMERKVEKQSEKDKICQNKIDQLLKANIANDVRNLVMQSYVEIKNKEEIERFSKESKDGDKFCNDVVEVNEKFSNVDCNIFELEKESGEKKNPFESKTCVFQVKIVELEKTFAMEKTFAKQTKENYDLLMKTDNLENAFADEVKRVTTGKLTAFDEENFVVQKDLSKPVTAHSLPKNEKDQLLKQIASLESKLASQDILSRQKKYSELRTSYNALKAEFDSLNQSTRKNKVFNSSKPKVSVSEKVHRGEFSKSFSKRVSQFITYSLQKDRKFSKKSQVFETSTS